MTNEQAAQLYRNAGRPIPADLDTTGRAASISKYNARKKEVDGIVFASTGEARCFEMLRLWEKAGVISGLELQVTYRLHDGFVSADGTKNKPIDYRPDFRFHQGGRLVVVDFKGMRTPAYVMKRKMFKAKYPEIEFREYDANTLKQNGV
jgi:hypothetical protein